MKPHFVKTSNYKQFMGAVNKVETGAPREARMLLLAGEPGTGKTRCVDYYGAMKNAIYIDGMPGMGMAYIRDLIAYELGAAGLKGFYQQKAINNAMADRGQVIILDEAQHGLEKKAGVIEYLRRICEQSGSMLILVCHTSERYRFAEHKLAHIATRISSQVSFQPANLEDTQLYLSELCEVKLDDGIIQQANNEARGRYRLLSSACRALEEIAKRLNKTELSVVDVKGITLCEDAMVTFKKGGIHGGK